MKQRPPLTSGLILALLAPCAVFAADLPQIAEPGRGGYVESELIYALDNKPTPQCHASTLVETPTGLVAAWFGGRHEKNPDVGIWVSRQAAGRWTKPVEVANGVQSATKRHPCWNPVLFQPRTGPLLLFYKVGPSPSTWWGMLTTSHDHGRQWSTPRKLGVDNRLGPKNPNLLGPVKNKPVQFADGTILCPSSSEHDGWRVHFELTRDGGKTWSVIGPINDGKTFAAIQPSILRHSDSKLEILCRTRQGVIGSSRSADNGQTWGPLSDSGLPNPNAGTDAVTLRDGRHLLVYNHTTRKSGFPSGRNMLNVAICSKPGMWDTVFTLERDKGEFSYPAVIQTSDGKVHTTYTYLRRSIKHAVIDPAAIK